MLIFSRAQCQDEGLQMHARQGLSPHRGRRRQDRQPVQFFEMPMQGLSCEGVTIVLLALAPQLSNLVFDNRTRPARSAQLLASYENFRRLPATYTFVRRTEDIYGDVVSLLGGDI